MKTKTALFLLLQFASLGSFGQSSNLLVVHEWGTFTSLQDENGRAISGINSDDEPVPAFVHDLNRLLIAKSDQLPVLYKGAPHCHPAVIMRLETPVIYFHSGSIFPLSLDVSVAWKGGWLTQFYPDAEAKAPGAFHELDANTLGTLRWNNLSVGSYGTGPETTEHVWVAPRAVKSANVKTVKGECEKFLFYRGVGRMNAPLRVMRDGEKLQIFSQLEKEFHDDLLIDMAWLAEFHEDGKCAFRQLGAMRAGADQKSLLLSTNADFKETEFSKERLMLLRSSIMSALRNYGLFNDEAAALLNTWELSYFQSGGTRLFFMVPQIWTDYYLPIKISTSPEIKRAMIGRIELITPAVKQQARRLAESPTPTKPWAENTVVNGRKVIKGEMPAAYRDLGRFRNALILEEQKLRPTASLNRFIEINGLGAFSGSYSPVTQ